MKYGFLFNFNPFPRELFLFQIYPFIEWKKMNKSSNEAGYTLWASKHQLPFILNPRVIFCHLKQKNLGAWFWNKEISKKYRLQLCYVSNYLFYVYLSRGILALLLLHLCCFVYHQYFFVKFFEKVLFFQNSVSLYILWVAVSVSTVVHFLFYIFQPI